MTPQSVSKFDRVSGGNTWQWQNRAPRGSPRIPFHGIQNRRFFESAIVEEPKGKPPDLQFHQQNDSATEQMINKLMATQQLSENEHIINKIYEAAENDQIIKPEPKTRPRNNRTNNRNPQRPTNKLCRK